MITLYSQILEAAIFPNSQTGLVLVPRAEPLQVEGRKELGEFFVPHGLFPKQIDIREISNGEDFLGDLEGALATQTYNRIFILPPFVSFRHLSDKLKAQYLQMSLDEIAIYVTISKLPIGSQIGVLTTSNILTDSRCQKSRELISQTAKLQYVITHDFSPHRLGFTNIHQSVRFTTLFFEVGSSELPIIRFFKIPLVEDKKAEEKILKDFKRLTTIEGGITDHGYVLRDGISDDSNWSHDANDPELQKKIKDMMHFGDVQPLINLVEIKHGLHMSQDASKLLDGTEDEGVPVIEGRNILAGNLLNFEETRYRAKNISPNLELRAGDICLRAIIGPSQNLFAVRIKEEMLPLVAANSIVILRPKSKELNVDYLLSYLQSDTAIYYLRSRGNNLSFYTRFLQELPIPILDESLSTAWASLREAKEIFDKWQEEAQSALNSLFAFQSAKDARLHLLSTGRLVRQRQQASVLLDSLAYRIRTQFPHPLAYRWRTIESSKPDLEGLVNILECAEISVCYLACVTILISRVVEEINIKYLDNLAEKLTNQKHGTGVGDWVAILREIRDSKAIKRYSGSIPFYEATRFLDDRDVDKALQFLTDNRNKQFHRKGAQGIQIPARFDECFSALKILFKSIEFLSEYNLRYVEETHRDSFTRITKYSFRSLMGDHPLSPITMDETPEIELEAHSLYLTDKNGQLYLLRPLLTRRVCPKCGRWTTFHLDSYDKKTGICNLNGLEHGHLVEDKSLTEVFKHVGMLV